MTLTTTHDESETTMNASNHPTSCDLVSYCDAGDRIAFHALLPTMLASLGLDTEADEDAGLPWSNAARELADARAALASRHAA